MENIPFWCVFVVFNVLASSEYFELKTECFPQWAHTLTLWKNKASFSQPSLSITILCILCMQGEAVRRTEAVCRGRALLWLVFNIKRFTFCLRAFEISSRASALVTDPELLGHGSNTQTAVTDLSHLCINQMSVEEKRTTVMGKIADSLNLFFWCYPLVFHYSWTHQTCLKTVVYIILSALKVIHDNWLYWRMCITATTGTTWNQSPPSYVGSCYSPGHC